MRAGEQTDLVLYCQQELQWLASYVGRATREAGVTASRAGFLASDNLAMIGKLRGDSDVKTTARFAHLNYDPVKQAANCISSSIAAAMEGKPSAQTMFLKILGLFAPYL